MPRTDETTFLHQVLCGDRNAIAFCQQLFATTQVIDDLIDRDRPVTDAEIFRSYWTCLFELPANPFYRAHEPYLRPIIASGFQGWWESVQLERGGGQHGRHIAFVLRDSLTSVVTQCAYLIGGYDWMQECAVAIRAHAHEDTLETYLSGLATQEAGQ